MQMCSLRLQFADLFNDSLDTHNYCQTGAFYFFQACSEDHPHDVFNFFQGQTNDPTVLSQSLWMFSVWLVFTSNLNSQTTWLKVKLKLVNNLERLQYMRQGACKQQTVLFCPKVTMTIPKTTRPTVLAFSQTCILCHQNNPCWYGRFYPLSYQLFVHTILQSFSFCMPFKPLKLCKVSACRICLQELACGQVREAYMKVSSLHKSMSP